MNQLMLVGRIKEKPEISTTSKGTSVAKMLVECDRNFRNEDGTFSKDVFQVVLWRGIAEECNAASEVGNLVAIRGRLKSDIYEKGSNSFYNYEVIAEKVSFLETK